MALATLTTRIDPVDKQRFELFCNAVGMNCSTAVNMLIKKVLHDKKMPEISWDELPNSETLAAIQESEALLNDPAAKVYDSPEDLFKELGI